MAQLKSQLFPTLSQGRAAVLDKFVMSVKVDQSVSSLAEVPKVTIYGNDADGNEQILIADEPLGNYGGTGEVERLVSLQMPMIPLLNLRYVISSSENLSRIDYVIIVTSHGIPVTLYGGE
jgi:hypothetical protein